MKEESSSTGKILENVRKLRFYKDYWLFPLWDYFLNFGGMFKIVGSIGSNWEKTLENRWSFVIYEVIGKKLIFGQQL